MSVDRKGCYDEARSPQVFLSLEAPHERRALPYTLLLDVELSSNSCLLKLTFSHYEVLVRGSRLEEVYESVRAAACAAIKPGRAEDRYSIDKENKAVVMEIRIKRLMVSP